MPADKTLVSAKFVSPPLTPAWFPVEAFMTSIALAREVEKAGRPVAAP